MIAPLLAAVIAVFPFVPQAIGVNDEVLPSSSQLATLRTEFGSALQGRGERVVFPVVTCRDVACARAAAAKSGAGAAVIVGVTRYMALLWNLDVETVNVQTGVGTGPWNNEYKGDFNALEYAMPQIAASVHDALKHR
jgi:hypothetical protein